MTNGITVITTLIYGKNVYVTIGPEFDISNTSKATSKYDTLSFISRIYYFICEDGWQRQASSTRIQSEIVNIAIMKIRYEQVVHVLCA